VSNLLTIGSRNATAVLDPSGNNTGNYTAVFDPASVAVGWTQYEVYQIVVQVPLLMGLVGWTVYNGLHVWDAFQSSGFATWEAAGETPLTVDSGETVWFYFDEMVMNSPNNNPPPLVTMWLQVNLDIAKRK